MTQTPEPPATPSRGRPPRAVKCVETGTVFGDCDAAAAWLAGMSVPLSPHTIRNCVLNGTKGGGFHWAWEGEPARARKSGPAKGCGGRSPKGSARPVSLVPRTPVVCVDTGACYRDADVAAEAMRAAGHPAEGKGVVAAVLSGDCYAGFAWDWRGVSLHFCGTEAETGRKCPSCAERAATETVAVAAEAGVDVGA